MVRNEQAQGRTYLNTAHGLGKYAEEHGALFDQERCQWYVVGEVSGDLAHLLPKASRGRTPEVVAPNCPICGFQTKLIEGENGPFFGCSRYWISRCNGSVNHDKYLASIGQPQLKSIGSILKPGFGQSSHSFPSASSADNKLPQSLQKAIAEIGKLCSKEFESKEELNRWLNAPKLALDWKLPIECMSTVEGCAKVKQLIQTRWE